MKNSKKIIDYLLGVIIFLFISCNNGGFKDQEGKTIKTVKIGNQIWMVENLNVSTFRNGDPIPEAKTTEEWKKAGDDGKPAWCYYDNESTNGEKYGKLYNVYAVIDPRGLAPSGWHIASIYGWDTLANELGYKELNHKVKSVSGWLQNGNGNNSSGLTVLPGGYRRSDRFEEIGTGAFFWNTVNDKFFNYISFGENEGGGGGSIDDRHITSGMSVRCILNSSLTEKEKSTTFDESKTKNDDIFIGDWYPVKTRGGRAFNLSYDGTNYILKNLEINQEAVLEKKNKLLLLSVDGTTTFRYDESTNHLFCSAPAETIEYYKK